MSGDGSGFGLISSGQQLIDVALRMSGDNAADDVGDVGLRIDLAELSGLDERGEDGPVFAAGVGAGVQGVLAGERQGSNGALDGVVVDLDPAVVEEKGQARPAGQRIADGLGPAPCCARGSPSTTSPMARSKSAARAWPCSTGPSTGSPASHQGPVVENKRLSEALEMCRPMQAELPPKLQRIASSSEHGTAGAHVRRGRMRRQLCPPPRLGAYQR